MKSYYSALSFARRCISKITPHKEDRLLYCNDPDKASDIIYDHLVSGSPCMIARFGSIELDITSKYLSDKLYHGHLLRYLFGKCPQWWWSDDDVKAIENNAGFINPTIENLTKFSQLMIQDMPLVDVLGSWCLGELLFEKQLANAKRVRLRYLEPFWSDKPWTRALKDKNVLVIHPFAKSIKQQYGKRERLFSNDNILPEFKSLNVIPAVQSIGGYNSSFTDWFEALHSMETEMDKIKYDVCLIGCGAYGFPLAAHAKRTGHKAVHLGGSLQLLFGIIGKRWFDPSSVQYKDYKDLKNEFWINPDESEKPAKAGSVENGCYW